MDDELDTPTLDEPDLENGSRSKQAAAASQAMTQQTREAQGEGSPYTSQTGPLQEGETIGSRTGISAPGGAPRQAPSYGFERFVERGLSTAGPRTSRFNRGKQAGGRFSNKGHALDKKSKGEAIEWMRDKWASLPAQVKAKYSSQSKMNDVTTPAEKVETEAYRQDKHQRENGLSAPAKTEQVAIPVNGPGGRTGYRYENQPVGGSSPAPAQPAADTMPGQPASGTPAQPTQPTAGTPTQPAANSASERSRLGLKPAKADGIYSEKGRVQKTKIGDETSGSFRTPGETMRAQKSAAETKQAQAARSNGGLKNPLAAGMNYPRQVASEKRIQSRAAANPNANTKAPDSTLQHSFRHATSPARTGSATAEKPTVAVTPPRPRRQAA